MRSMAHGLVFIEASFLPRLAPEFNFTGGIPCKYSERLGFPPKNHGGTEEKISGASWLGWCHWFLGFFSYSGSFRPTKPSGQRVSLTGWGYHFSVDVFFCNKMCHLGLTWGEDMIFSDSKPQEAMEQNMKGFTGGLENWTLSKEAGLWNRTYVISKVPGQNFWWIRESHLSTISIFTGEPSRHREDNRRWPSFYK